MGFVGVSMMLKEQVSRFIASGDLTGATISASVDIELLLILRLFSEEREKPTTLESLERVPLGPLIETAAKRKLIDAEETKFLRKFKDLRNNVVHNRSFVGGAVQNEAKKQKILDVLERAADFIRKTEIHYKLDKEKEFVEYTQRNEKRFFSDP